MQPTQPLNLSRRHLLCASTLAAMGAAHAQPASPAPPAAFAPADLEWAERLRDAAMGDTEAWALLQQLCTEIGARPAGSAGDVKAVAWAQAAMQRLGLSAVRAEPLNLRVWQRGPASARLVVPVDEALVMAALGNSVATPAEGITAEVAWYPSLAALQADDSDRPRGRIVFIDPKMERFRDGRGYGPAVGARVNGAVVAAKKGALALGIRSIGTDRDRIAHTGAMAYEIGAPRIPAFAVSVPDAERLASLQAQGQVMRLHLQLASKSDVDAVTHNVIGEVPGTDLANEIVLIGAHLDSWDLGQGAQDDGAGVHRDCGRSASGAHETAPPPHRARGAVWQRGKRLRRCAGLRRSLCQRAAPVGGRKRLWRRQGVADEKPCAG